MAARPVYNGNLSATGYGTKGVRLTAITFGTTIISTTGDARTYRTLYTNAQSSFSFGIAIICPTFEEYASLGEWIEGYGRSLLTSSVGLMRVRLPSRGFDRIGVPSGATFGAESGEKPRKMSIGFIGAADLVSLSTTDVTRLSNFIQKEWSTISGKDKATPYFYPAGQQLSGQATGADMLYDSTGPAREAPGINNIPTPHGALPVGAI